VTIVQQFPNVLAAIAHYRKPALRDRAQLAMFTQPNVDGRISHDCTWKAHKLGHVHQSSIASTGNTVSHLLIFRSFLAWL
jgi:hypothetical protein